MNPSSGWNTADVPVAFTMTHSEKKKTHHSQSYLSFLITSLIHHVHHSTLLFESHAGGAPQHTYWMAAWVSHGVLAIIEGFYERGIRCTGCGCNWVFNRRASGHERVIQNLVTVSDLSLSFQLFLGATWINKKNIFRTKQLSYPVPAACVKYGACGWRGYWKSKTANSGSFCVLLMQLLLQKTAIKQIRDGFDLLSSIILVLVLWHWLKPLYGEPQIVLFQSSSTIYAYRVMWNVSSDEVSIQYFILFMVWVVCICVGKWACCDEMKIFYPACTVSNQVFIPVNWHQFKGSGLSFIKPASWEDNQISKPQLFAVFSPFSPLYLNVLISIENEWLIRKSREEHPSWAHDVTMTELFKWISEYQCSLVDRQCYARCYSCYVLCNKLIKLLFISASFYTKCLHSCNLSHKLTVEEFFKVLIQYKVFESKVKTPSVIGSCDNQAPVKHSLCPTVSTTVTVTFRFHPVPEIWRQKTRSLCWSRVPSRSSCCAQTSPSVWKTCPGAAEDPTSSTASMMSQRVGCNSSILSLQWNQWTLESA